MSEKRPYPLWVLFALGYVLPGVVAALLVAVVLARYADVVSGQVAATLMGVVTAAALGAIAAARMRFTHRPTDTVGDGDLAGAREREQP